MTSFFFFLEAIEEIIILADFIVALTVQTPQIS